MLKPVQVGLRVRIADNFFEVFNLCCFMLGFLPLLVLFFVAMIRFPP
jgi:hypothetical protein